MSVTNSSFLFQLSHSYDSKLGGFGSAPKFPRPVEIQLMLYYSKKLKETGKIGEANEGQKMVLFSLQWMAKGGIHDHVGGGFHRYSVDEHWHGEFSIPFLFLIFPDFISYQFVRFVLGWICTITCILDINAILTLYSFLSTLVSCQLAFFFFLT